jgi:uncharacterized membrane protein
MGKGRLEAFSDGVIAIIITIMVLELRVPHADAVDTGSHAGSASFHDLQPLLPVFVSYVLSFVYVAIYWNNHHHMLHASRVVSGGILWANTHLLFWLSLVPFVTSWMGENGFAAAPVALYGMVLLMCAIAYTILARVLVRRQGPRSALATALGEDRKGRVSLALYAAAVTLAFVNRWVALAIYFAVAVNWLIPDRRNDRILTATTEPPPVSPVT